MGMSASDLKGPSGMPLPNFFSLPDIDGGACLTNTPLFFGAV